MYVRPLPDVRRCGAASPLTSHVTKRGQHYGRAVILQDEGGAQGHDRTNKAHMARQRRSWLSDYRTPLE